MPPTPPETDPVPDEHARETPLGETPRGETPLDETPRGETPLTFVPHEASGALDAKPASGRRGRYEGMEINELLRLLGTAEDERARARFRESVYLSLFIWLAIVALIIFGPKYLWHAPQIKMASNLHDHQLMMLNAPVLTRHAPVVPPRIDEETLRHLREMDRRPAPPPPPAPVPQPETHTAPTPAPAPTPLTPVPKPALPLPSAPQPTRTPSAPVPEAPTPQPSASHNPFSVSRRPNFSAPGGQSISGPSGALRGGGAAGSGAQILSDTQGVDFDPWIRRFLRETKAIWEPMLPEEVYPPLSKRGTTAIDITVGPDGTIMNMKPAGSTHDDALNRAAWGSVTSQGKLAPLPKDFHGPYLMFRVYFVVGDQGMGQDD